MTIPRFSDRWKDRPARCRAEDIVRSIQDRIWACVLAIEGDGGGGFTEDVWQRQDHSEGGGITRVLQVCAEHELTILSLKTP
jgi:coproporphyrinogen III oxidase